MLENKHFTSTMYFVISLKSVDGNCRPGTINSSFIICKRSHVSSKESVQTLNL